MFVLCRQRQGLPKDNNGQLHYLPMTTHAVSLLPLLCWDPSSEHYYLGEHTVNKVLFHQYLVWCLWRSLVKALRNHTLKYLRTLKINVLFSFIAIWINIWIIFFGCTIYDLKLIEKNVLISIHFILTSTNYYYFYSLLHFKRLTLFTLHNILRGIWMDVIDGWVWMNVALLSFKDTSEKVVIKIPMCDWVMCKTIWSLQNISDLTWRFEPEILQ